MSWLGISRQLGQSLLELLKAELEALGSDLGASAQKLLRIGGVLAAALFLAFWSIGILAYLAVELLNIVLPPWAASLTVLAVFVLATVVCGSIAKRRIGRLESPTATLSRRFEDHRDWWESRIVGQELPASEANQRDRVGGDEL